MIESIPGGHILIAREIRNSRIWIKPLLYLKLFLWIIMEANHTERTRKGYTYKRGELVTTYSEITKAMSYFYNRKCIVPSVKQIRVILTWLVSEGMIEVHPLKDSELPNKGRPSVQTRAYVGIIIVVVNYDTYQTAENYKGRHKGRPSSELGHNNNNDKKENIYIVHHADEKCLLKDGIDEVLQVLNEYRSKMLGRNGLRPITSDKNIIARLKDGSTVHECCRIVVTKSQDPYFIDNPKYFHPDTLFRKSHWDRYLDEAELLRGGHREKQT